MEEGNFEYSFPVFLETLGVSVKIARDDSEVSSLWSKFDRIASLLAFFWEKLMN